MNEADTLAAERARLIEQLCRQRDGAIQRWTNTSWLLAFHCAPIERRIAELPTSHGTPSGDYPTMQAALRLLAPVIERVKDDLATAEDRFSTVRFECRAAEDAEDHTDLEDILDDYLRALRRSERSYLESVLELLDSIERLQARWSNVVTELGATGDGPTADEDLRTHWATTAQELRILRGSRLLRAPGIVWHFRVNVVTDRRIHNARLGLTTLHEQLLAHLQAVHSVTRLTDDRLIGAYPPFETTRIERREDTGNDDAIVVARILEHGYIWHDHLLRKAAVTVRSQQGVSN